MVSDIDLLEVDQRRDDKFFGDWWCEWKQISGLHRKERERSLTKRRDKIFGFKNWNGVFICFNNFCLFQRKVAFKIAGKFQSLKYLCICCSVWLPRKWEENMRENNIFFYSVYFIWIFLYNCWWELKMEGWTTVWGFGPGQTWPRGPVQSCTQLSSPMVLLGYIPN